MRNKSVAIIATRPESKRLPGKVFRKVAGVPAIEHILRRLSMKTILAVPEGCHDYDYLKKTFPDIEILHGNGASPLHRISDIIKKRNEKWIVRITHDDILIDQETINKLILACENRGAAYGYTPTIVEGAGVEVIHRKNIIIASEEKKDPTEYLSYFVKENPIKIRPRESIERNYRLTMDYYEDWIVLDTVLRKVGPYSKLDDVVEYIDRNPYVMNWNKLPDISVYTCVRNSEKWINKTITSVLSQNNTSFEYIIVDDVSYDNTDVEIMKFSDSRIKYYRNEENIGLASSSNFAISMAKGKYVVRVDADDKLYMGTLNRMKNIISSSKADIVYSGYNEIDSDDKPIKMNCPADIYHHAGCAIMDKKVINEIRFTEGLRHWDSLDLIKRIRNKNAHIEYVKEPLWAYRKHSGSMSSVMTEERRKILEEIKENALLREKKQENII